MVTACETVDEHYPAVAASVPQARGVVTDFAERAGLSGERLQGLRVAVSEAVSNVVLHAYRGREGEVQIAAAVAADELWALVADTGCGYQTPSKNPGFGFGLALIADACDEFVITERADGGTEARMRFLLQDHSSACG
jgi:anti-sigma regulatory factor (Ser/Thr protein kinase)